MTLLLLPARSARTQVNVLSGDVLGAHLSYGRGCAACHVPHSGGAADGRARGSGVSSGMQALWGEEASGIDEEAIGAGENEGPVERSLSSAAEDAPDVPGMLSCLSCHDGNLASRAMMRNGMYEQAPAAYPAGSGAPTLLGEGSAFSSVLNEHPVGLGVVMDCGALGWDCFQSEGIVSMSGTKSSQFVQNYGLFVKPGRYKDLPVVVCTTCHNPHSMNAVAVDSGTRSGLPSGRYGTMFFLRGPYSARSQTPGNNQPAQFCRQCHGAVSNEMAGLSLPTVF